MKHRSRFKCMLTVVLPGVLLLGACAPVRYPRSYVLSFPQPAPQTRSAKDQLGTVLVREFQCPEYLRQGRIVYRPSPEEVGFYEYHRWAVDPRQAVTQFMVETLRAQSLFAHVAAYERGKEAAYVLSGRIERLEEVDRGSDVSVECATSAELVDAHTGVLMWNDRASEALPIVTRSMTGVVDGLSKAARMTVDHLVQSLEKQLSGPRK